MSNPRALFQHIHFRKLTPFRYPQELQEKLARQFLDHKASRTEPPSPPPVPKIITFQAEPVYTTGRRENDTLTKEVLERLRAPGPVFAGRPGFEAPIPEVWPTQRGGQITFHGPGQTVFYPILDIRAQYPLWPKGLSPRCYVNLLEQTTINTLARWGIKSIRTENPGVWAEDGERKIAALGVHLRRNVTSYGVGLNIHTYLPYFDRIVACGLEGKKVTSMKALTVERDPSLEATWRMTTEKARRTILAKQDDAAVSEEPVAEDRTSVRVLNRKSAAQVGEVWIQEFLSGLYGEDQLPELVDRDGLSEYKRSREAEKKIRARMNREAGNEEDGEDGIERSSKPLDQGEAPREGLVRRIAGAPRAMPVRRIDV